MNVGFDCMLNTHKEVARQRETKEELLTHVRCERATKCGAISILYVFVLFYTRLFFTTFYFFTIFVSFSFFFFFGKFCGCRLPLPAKKNKMKKIKNSKFKKFFLKKI